jgi:methionyl-tRNA formyltransferase
MRILIVIDNIIQYERLKILLSEKETNKVEFVFKHSAVRSAIWDHEDFNDHADSIIDVKNDIEYVLQQFDLVVSVHCFQFFPKKLVSNVRCINVHPGYNPINRGWYPQVFAIIHDLPIGATIHEMDEKLDHGPIIARSFVDKYPWDTSESIYNRVLEKEMELFDLHFDKIVSGEYESIAPEDRGNLFSKADFKQLCEINLEEKATFREFYDRLRALTHGDYKNAFFIDQGSGKKVFLKLDITTQE